MKKVFIKTTEIIKITNPDTLVRKTTDINGAIAAAASLFVTPAVPFAMLKGGADVVTAAKTVYDNGRNPARKAAIVAAMVALKELHRTQIDYIVDICNDPANATTRQQASDNILLSGYTPHKLQASKKGIPSKPEVSAKNSGVGHIELSVPNVAYSANRTTFILSEFNGISVENGQAIVEIEAFTNILPKPKVSVRTVNGKRAMFTHLNSGRTYYYAAFGENAQGVFGLISEVKEIVCT